MCSQWSPHIISGPSHTWGNSLQLKAYLLLSCLTMDPHSMVRNSGSLPMILTSCTPHHHPISINPMDSSRPWWRKSRMPTRKLMVLPMLKLEHYFSYVTHPSHQIFPPQQKFYMDQDHQNVSIYPRFGRNSFNFRENKENFDKVYRAKGLCVPKVKEKVQMFQNKQGTGPLKWTTGPGPQW